MKKNFFLTLIFFLNFDLVAADSKIAYININHILNNSNVGQSISKYINNIKENKFKDFDNVEKLLSEKEAKLIKKKNIIDKDQFNDEVDILKKEIVEYKNEKKKFINEIDQKKIKYTKVVLNSLNPIISKYVEENSIEIVFSKKDIIIAKKDLDITNQIMDLLNSQLDKIDF